MVKKREFNEQRAVYVCRLWTVIDCPDPAIPANAWFRRTADGHGVVGCRRRDVTGRDVTWSLECGRGLEWNRDVTELLLNCSLREYT